MALKDKKLILGIVKEGQEATKILNNNDLKEKILRHFQAIEKMVNEDLYLEELEDLSKKLIIGVNEALVFGDVDILSRVEVTVQNDISRLND
jgi:hypothetical protein